MARGENIILAHLKIIHHAILRYISVAFNQFLPLTIAIPVTFEKTPDVALQSEYPLLICKWM